MNGFARRTEAKRKAIIAAARELFTKQGFIGVGIAEIAAKANVSPVSIYNYFGDKRTLAKEVFIYILNEIIQEYEEILDRDISFSEKIEIIMAKKHEAIIAASRSNFKEEAWSDKTLRQLYWDVVAEKSAELYSKFIDLGIQEGAIDERIPKEAIMKFLYSLKTIMQEPQYLQTSAEYKLGLIRLFLYGLLGKASS
ncbi:MAG: TetR/AcrR family transcriptional regulator [bacterium]|jgi:AcrR family transcriptional regulator